MENEKEKLNRFITAVNSVTDKQVDDIMNDAVSEKQRILTAAAQVAEDAKSRYMSDHQKMTSNKYVRMVSKAEFEMKKEALLCREKLTHELFDKVYAQLAAYRKTGEYSKWLCEEIEKTRELENPQICVAPEDLPLTEKISGVEISSDDSIRLGGFYILLKSNGTITDRTFDCAIKEQQSLFSSRNLLA